VSQYFNTILLVSCVSSPEVPLGITLTCGHSILGRLHYNFTSEAVFQSSTLAYSLSGIPKTSTFILQYLHTTPATEHRPNHEMAIAATMDADWVKVERDDTPMVGASGNVTARKDIPVYDEIKTIKEQVEFIKIQREGMKPVLVQCRKTKGFRGKDPEENEGLQRLTGFLAWLDTKLQMTPEIRERTTIDAFVRQVFNPAIFFPAAYADKAKALHDKWEAENWGKVKGESSDDAKDGSRSPLKRSSGDHTESSSKRSNGQQVAAATNDGVKTLYVPPENDPIWGRNGIMHGIAIRRGPAGKSNLMNPRLSHEKREAKVFGHNGLENGQWFPFRLNAIFHGAHGASQAGISGDSQTGAYSIVVSSQYDEFDSDLKDTIIYCGAGGNDNTNPDQAAQSAGSSALRASRRKGNDVRVLRTATGHSVCVPSVGLRYDGLYRVVGVDDTKRNSYGGMVERFKLVRQPDQPKIDESRPTSREVRQYNMIGQTTLRGWTATRE